MLWNWYWYLPKSKIPLPSQIAWKGIKGKEKICCHLFGWHNLAGLRKWMAHTKFPLPLALILSFVPLVIKLVLWKTVKCNMYCIFYSQNIQYILCLNFLFNTFSIRYNIIKLIPGIKIRFLYSIFCLQFLQPFVRDSCQNLLYLSFYHIFSLLSI